MRIKYVLCVQNMYYAYKAFIMRIKYVLLHLRLIKYVLCVQKDIYHVYRRRILVLRKEKRRRRRRRNRRKLVRRRWSRQRRTTTQDEQQTACKNIETTSMNEETRPYKKHGDARNDTSMRDGMQHPRRYVAEPKSQRLQEFWRE